MNGREARALGRYCEKHRRKHERIHFESGAAMTGCPDCAADPAFREAVDALVEAAKKHGEAIRRERERSQSWVPGYGLPRGSDPWR